MSDMQGHEQRRYRRVSVSLITHLRRREAETALATNASLGGVFIETRVQYRIGDLLEFDMQVPKSDQKIACKGVVRWCKTDEPRGIGVEFAELTTTSRAWLQAHLRAQETQRGRQRLMEEWREGLPG